MKNFTTLPTANEEWGFWGTCKSNGYDAELAWQTASGFFAKTFDLTPEETRMLLDARFGRHLADDLSFIDGGPATAEGIIAHLEKRNADKGWRKHYEKAIHEETGKRIKQHATSTEDQLFTMTAQQHFGIDTLEERKSDSLDFHDVSVLSIKAALHAAYHCGLAQQQCKKGA